MKEEKTLQNTEMPEDEEKNRVQSAAQPEEAAGAAQPEEAAGTVQSAAQSEEAAGTVQSAAQSEEAAGTVQSAAKSEKPDETVPGQKISPTWAHECIEDIDDWIESQGIYLRQ